MRLTRCAAVLVFVGLASISSQTQAPPAAADIRKLSTTLRGSGCSAAGIESGDPVKGPSIIVEKFEAGCVIPWHWHTPNEHLMVVGGTFLVEIRSEQPVHLSGGDFARIPSHHVMQVTCVGTDPCVNFLYTDAPADIHFVDESGAEISSDQALKNYAKTHPKQN